MPAPKKPSPAALRDAFINDLSAVWEYAQTTHGKDQPYALALYGVEGQPELFPQVLTEGGLSAVAAKYVERQMYETLDEARKALRFSVADSPLFREFAERLPTVRALWEPVAYTIDEIKGYDILAKAAIAAFKKLDEAGTFGKGEEREKVLLIVITEDTDVEWAEKSAKQSNPAGVFKKYQEATAVDGPYASTDAMVVAADGKSIYALKARENPKSKPGRDDEFINEIVGYDVQGFRVRLRWAYDLTPIDGQHRNLALAADGKSVLAMVYSYKRKSAGLWLKRLAAADGKLLAEARFKDDGKSTAVSADGKHIAVGTDEATVLLLDPELKILHTVDVESRPRSLLFLRSTGQLLVGDDRTITRVDPAAGKVVGVVNAAGHCLSCDASERMLTTSKWFDSGADEPEPFGVGLRSLPDLKALKQFDVPDRAAVLPALSPDGRRLVLESHPVDAGGSIYAVVFDVETGKPLGQRKVDGHKQMRFMPDSQTIAIPTAGYTSREPLDLWRP
jgi:hypothetical protein